MPPGASGESQCTCARGPTSGVLPRSGILSAAPKHGILVPIADAFARILPCGAAWARTPHDTCSPTWSGIGSDKDPTLDPPSLVIKPREEDLTPGTVKPVQVSLVEPVAYQFQLGVNRRKQTIPAYRYLCGGFRRSMRLPSSSP